MTLDLFSSILSSGSSEPAEGDESEVGVESRDLGWDDRSVISGKDGREDRFSSMQNAYARCLILQPLTD